jgi:hypothetical protein
MVRSRHERQYLASSAPKRTPDMRLPLAAAVLGFVTYASNAAADEVSPNGKGTVGGALLGGEVVVIVEAIAGVHKTWAYGVGAAVGAVGGGIGGYFIEQGSSDGRIPVAMLAGGMALVIPALVLTLNATRYMPDETATEDKAPTNQPAANPGTPGGSSVEGVPGAAPPPSGGSGAPAPSAPPPPPQSLLDLQLLDRTVPTVRLGVPAPRVMPMWSPKEEKEYGFRQGTEVRMPVVGVTF